MEDSILNTIKKSLEGLVDETNDVFDTELIIFINSAFGILHQIGVGPENGFRIRDSNSKWTDFIADNNNLLESVKEYIYLKVKLKFDPPTSSAAIEAMKQSIAEHEWRFSVKDSFLQKGGA